jgi:hypothetical protein
MERVGWGGEAPPPRTAALSTRPTQDYQKKKSDDN